MPTMQVKRMRMAEDGRSGVKTNGGTNAISLEVKYRYFEGTMTPHVLKKNQHTICAMVVTFISFLTLLECQGFQ